MHGMVRLPQKAHRRTINAGKGVCTKSFTMSSAKALRRLVFVEASVGLLVLLGLWTRRALIVGALTMAALVFGTALRSDWNTLAIQMLYALIYAALMATREYNEYSLDGRIAR